MKRINPCSREELERLYWLEKLSGTQIAKRFGVGGTTIFRWMAAYGIKRRNAGRPEIVQPLKQDLIRLYIHDRLSAVDIARRFNCSNVIVGRWLAKYGISLRSTSEVANLAMERKSYEERLRNTAASRAIIKGRSQTAEHRRKIAMTKQNRANLSRYEAELLVAINKIGFHPVMHLAVDIFNIDLAFPSVKLAIEIDGGCWHNTPKKRQQDNRKQIVLKREGWKILHISTRRKDWIIPAIEIIMSHLQ